MSIRYFHCPGCGKDFSADTFEEAAREIAYHVENRCIDLEQATQIVSDYCQLNKNQVKSKIDMELDRRLRLRQLSN